MMKHEEYRELLALRLYGELDAAETERLDQHLGDCGACADYACELEAGLGTQKARAEEYEDALPADWQERLAEATAPRPRAFRARAVLTFVTGLAAGLLIMAFNPRAPDVGPVESEIAGSGFTTNRPSESLRLELPDGPPPPASGRGSYGMLGLALRSQ